MTRWRRRSSAAFGIVMLSLAGGCAMPVSFPLAALTGAGGGASEAAPVTTASAGTAVEEDGISTRLGRPGWVAMRAAVIRAVEGGEDGETFAWRSEASGLTGTVTTVSAYFGESGAMCRTLAITAARSDLNDVFLAEACRGDAGGWRIAPTTGEA